MTEQQREEQENVSVSYLLELKLSRMEYSAMDWLTDSTKEPENFDVPDFDFNRSKNTITITIADRCELNWLEFYAQQAEHAATRAIMFTKSSSTAERRQKAMHDLALTLRKAIGLVKL